MANFTLIENLTTILETSDVGQFTLSDSFQLRSNLMQVMCDLFTEFKTNDTKLAEIIDMFMNITTAFDEVENDGAVEMRQVVASVIGFVAGILTTVASSPQIYKTIKTRNTMPLSIYSLLVLWFGLLGWIVYGALLNNWVIIVCNVITIGLYTLLIGLKIVFDKQAKAKLRAETMDVEMDPIYKRVVNDEIGPIYKRVVNDKA